jgi:ABC-type multidrug transport system fused ATPase/permease subunit
VEKANRLQSEVVVRFVDVKEWIDAEKNIDCIVLISDFVAGLNLRDFIAKNRRTITVAFVVQFLETILELFNEMAALKEMHGDFHAGNVLVEERSYALRGPPYAFRVTDFGVASATSDARFRDDYLQLADILRTLLEQVTYQEASSRDKFIFNALNDQFLARHLVENNPTLDSLAKNPRGLFARLRELDTEFERAGGDESAQLLTPFDFLSCEQIGDAPTLLKALYSELFLGLPEIESRNNIVVTGPRGCGKTTVFKSLSLRQKLRVDEAQASKIDSTSECTTGATISTLRFRATSTPNELRLWTCPCIS